MSPATVPADVDEESDQELLTGRARHEDLAERLLEPLWSTPRWMKPALIVTFAMTLMLVGAVLYTMVSGIGVWGNRIPVVWAFAITNFVWWIGIGHAGTFISAFLLLLEQKWRASINRFAEAMTIFAVMQAALFPLLHLGRPWYFYWLVPYPSTMSIWPQFRSALTWDVAAISTYFTVSVLFWYLGLVPDFAVARDRAPTKARRLVYGVFALGWRGSASGWMRYRTVYALLAGVAAPLVVSVHSIVSMDFATAQLPGWHSEIFPPFFVAGAILSGLAMVFLLMLPVRRLYRLEEVITVRHLDMLARFTLVTSCIVGYSYAAEAYNAAYGGDVFEMSQIFSTRARGPFAWAFWGTIVCNVLAPQILWLRRARRSAPFLFALSFAVQVGMWVERFLIIVASQSRDFLPSSFRTYTPSFIDGTILVGTLGCFLFLMLLFIRYVPFIPIREVQRLQRSLAEERSA